MGHIHNLRLARVGVMVCEGQSHVSGLLIKLCCSYCHKFNPCHVEFIYETLNIFTYSVISPYRDGAGIWNLLQGLDDAGGRASAALALTQFSRNVLITKSEGTNSDFYEQLLILKLILIAINILRKIPQMSQDKWNIKMIQKSAEWITGWIDVCNIYQHTQIKGMSNRCVCKWSWLKNTKEYIRLACRNSSLALMIGFLHWWLVSYIYRTGIIDMIAGCQILTSI